MTQRKSTRIEMAALCAVIGCTLGMALPVNSCPFSKSDGQTKSMTKDIVDTAMSAGSFGTLVSAVQQAGLVETLKGSGPFTVFAPTDEAFKKIPEADLQAIIKDKEQLKKILTFHVVPGVVSAKKVAKLTSANTVEGSALDISTGSCGVTVSGAKVTQADIICSNGIIHVIDTVMIPEK